VLGSKKFGLMGAGTDSNSPGRPVSVRFQRMMNASDVCAGSVSPTLTLTEF
jgi:hypothetical protein